MNAQAVIKRLGHVRDELDQATAALKRAAADLNTVLFGSAEGFDVVSPQLVDRRAREGAFDVGRGYFCVGNRCVISEGPGTVVDVVQDGECTVELDHDLGRRTVKWHQVLPYQA